MIAKNYLISHSLWKIYWSMTWEDRKLFFLRSYQRFLLTSPVIWHHRPRGDAADAVERPAGEALHPRMSQISHCFLAEYGLIYSLALPGLWQHLAGTCCQLGFWDPDPLPSGSSVNARSPANKMLIIIDFFYSHDLDFFYLWLKLGWMLVI